VSLAVALAIGCASTSAEKAPETAHLSADASTVRSRLPGWWKLVEIGGRPAGGYLFFDARSYSVSADCNHIFGEYELVGNLVVTKTASSTLMDCKGPPDPRRSWPQVVSKGRYRVFIDRSELVVVGEEPSSRRWARYVATSPQKMREEELRRRAAVHR
jgi:hypothetical protein